MKNANQWESYAGVIGLDWGDKRHACCMRLPDGRQTEGSVVNTPEAISEWADELRQQAGGRRFAIGLEQSRGAVCSALLEHSDVLELYPINPISVSLFRKVWSVANAKDDPSDARLLLDMMWTHPERMKPLRQADPSTQLLGLLNLKRRKLVDMRTKCIEMLISQLKEYFPQALELAGSDWSHKMNGEFLKRWPTLHALKRARPSTIKQFYYRHNTRSPKCIEQRMDLLEHATPLTTSDALIQSCSQMALALVDQIRQLNRQIQGFDAQIRKTYKECADAEIFTSFPGAGPVLAPRLLAIFGSDRTRWTSAEELQRYSGVAPVVRRSGNSCKISRRYARPRFDHQTFVEYARCSKRYCAWAAAYHEMMRANGKGENAILRALAFKWIRIMYTCWKNDVPYNDRAYTETLRKRGVPYLKYIQVSL